MASRFQIEDLVTQDAAGVIFRAVDTETGRLVAVQRFFPFGANGRGLCAAEQAAYGIAAGRLPEIKHPALRSIIGSGCDPVDGMPYLVSEWLDGTSLRSRIERGLLPSAEATAIIVQALEVSEFLSQVFAEEAVWVETDPQAIIIGAEGSGITFGISPLKWLGQNDRQRGLEVIASLAEDIVNEKTAGNGLRRWRKWLCGAAATTTLREARERLTSATSARPPTPKLAHSTVHPVTKKKPRVPTPLAFAASLALLVTGFGGWAWGHRDFSSRATSAAPSTAEIVTPGGMFASADHARPLAENQQEVVEGVFTAIGYSKSKKTMYCQFSKDASGSEVRGAIKVKGAPADLTESKLVELIGKKVRLRGKLRIEKVANFARSVIWIESRSAIQVLE